MNEKILDSIKGINPVNEQFKNPKLLVFTWALYGLSCLFWGFSWIYRYSAPNINWFTIKPINYQYEMIIIGIFSLFIANKIHLKKKDVFQLVTSLLLVSLVFFVTSSLYYWNIWTAFTILFFIANGFNFVFINTVLITLATYNNAIPQFTLTTIFTLQKKYWLLLIIGLTPIPLSLMMDYTFFECLHY